MREILVVLIATFSLLGLCWEEYIGIYTEEIVAAVQLTPQASQRGVFGEAEQCKVEFTFSDAVGNLRIADSLTRFEACDLWKDHKNVTLGRGVGRIRKIEHFYLKKVLGRALRDRGLLHN